MDQSIDSKSVKPRASKKIYNKKLIDIYSDALLTRVIEIPMNAVGSGIKEKLEKKLRSMIEGKCISEGFVKPRSIKVLTYSSGKIYDGNKIHFETTFEVKICLPVEGMLMECVAKNITKAGIRSEVVSDESESPVVIFVARDHHYSSDYFSSIKENDSIKIRVIGQRFELNDKYISIIAELIEPKKRKDFKTKPRLVLKPTL
jgi:DNA-directed RNA polymerase subunit E'/Rpb7